MTIATDIELKVHSGPRPWPLSGPAVALFALWLVLAWPWLSGSVTIPWDGKAHFTPQVQFLAASLTRGEGPWWAPYVFAGHPQIADPQAMIFSPPMVLLSLFNASPSLTAIDTTVLAMVLFGGLGVLVYARLVGWHWVAALVAALIFMFGGAMAWRLQHFGQVISLAYVPFTLVLLHLAIHRGQILAGIGAGVLGAAILLGRDQVALLSIYLLAAFAITELVHRLRAGQAIRWGAVALVAGAVVGIALVALPLWMTLLLAEQSNRPTIDLAGAGAGSLHPALLLTVFSANLFASAGPMAEFWGPPSFAWADTGLFLAQNMGVVYFSALGLLVLAVGVARGGLFAADTAFFVAACAVMLVYALGWFTPLFSLFYQLIPGVDRFRRPADATFLVGGLLAFVVGGILSRAISDLDRAKARNQLTSATIVAVVITVVGLSAALAVGVWRGETTRAAMQVAQAAAVFAVTLAGVAFAIWLKPLRPVLAGAIVVALVALDLRLANGPNGASALPLTAVDMLEPSAPHPTISAVRTRLAGTAGPARADRAELVGLGYHWPNAPLTHALPVTLGTNPVRLSWYAHATGAVDTIATLDQRQFSALMPDYGSPLARRLGLKWVVMPSDASPVGGLERVSVGQVQEGVHTIYELPDPLPRAVFASRARRVDFDDLMQAPPPSDYADPDVVLLESGADEGAVRAAEVETDAEPARTAITVYENNRIVLAVETDRPGWVVLHDTWHPWWRATVNGAPRPVLRANGVFRAVRVDAGSSTVTLTFAPVSSAIEEAMARLAPGQRDETQQP